MTDTTNDVVGSAVETFIERNHASDPAYYLDTDHIGLAQAGRDCAVDSSDASMNDFITNSINILLTNSRPPEWNMYLVSLRWEWASLFGTPSDSFVVKHRSRMAGIKLFDQHVQDCVRINCLTQFVTNFTVATRGALLGYCFANVVVAGGIVLACLTGTPEEISPRSDVDLFIYSLSPEEATRKVYDLEATLRGNVPNFGSHYVVHRTVSTISFIPVDVHSGLRKIQVVLRLHKNPAEIISSFDLDQTAMYYNGEDVKLETRAVRALFTGYSYVTAKQIETTSIGRIAKYSQRGYGLNVRVGLSDTAEEMARASALLQRVSISQLWIDHRMRVAERRLSMNPPEYSTLRVSHLLSIIRGEITGTWTTSFKNLALCSAIWGTTAHDPTSQQHFLQAVGGQSEYAQVDGRPDYNQNELALNAAGNGLWMQALEDIVRNGRVL
ncbi:hypothetical protein CF326_g3892 [Tilletia indica]|nr:hypothetical protein CF326_g3892 [Tilletia indica]